MRFEENAGIKRLGRFIGTLVAFIIFTSVLHFILKITKDNYSIFYIDVLIGTIVVYLLIILFKKIKK